MTLYQQYDTLTKHPNRTPEFYLARHLRKRGTRSWGAGRLVRFGMIAKYKPISTRDVIDGRIDRVFVAEYNHYVWRVRPLCVYCGAVLGRNTLTRDHVVPRSKGGGRGDNLVPACAPCNRAKADHTLLQFLVMRQRD